MRRIVLLVGFLFVALSECLATRWVARVTTNVNLREGPSTLYDIIVTIPKNAYIYYNDEEICDGFVPVIYIDTDIHGYISNRYIKNEQEVAVDDSGQLQLVGTTEEYDPEINIENNTNVTMTLRMNDKEYKFSPREKKPIIVPPGQVTMTASSPGVIPYVGIDYVESNYVYDWVFYIKTVRR